MPTISIIVPVYKVEPYLRQCADSVLAQSFTDFELILVDDGSPDNCSAICDEYAEKDERVRVIHQANGGLSAARNAGIDAAKGEYLTFIDSDDMVSPVYCEKLYSAILRNNVKLSMCGFVSFGNESELSCTDPDEVCEESVISGRDACVRRYGDNDEYKYAIACAKLFHRTLFDGLRFPVGKVHEDEATIPIALYCCEQIAEIGDSLYYYRQTPGSIMNSGFSAKRYDALYGFKRCMDYFDKQGDTELTNLVKAKYDRFSLDYFFDAKSSGMVSSIPKEYRKSELHYWRALHKYTDENSYQWFLQKYHPAIAKFRLQAIRVKAILRAIIRHIKKLLLPGKDGE